MGHLRDNSNQNCLFILGKLYEKKPKNPVLFSIFEEKDNSSIVYARFFSKNRLQ